MAADKDYFCLALMVVAAPQQRLGQYPFDTHEGRERVCVYARERECVCVRERGSVCV
jgi:hypothetical protein